MPTRAISSSLLLLTLSTACGGGREALSPSDDQSGSSALPSLAATGACVRPPSGVVSWWPGDSNTTDIVGSNDGTLFGRAGFASGKVGAAFRFEGLQDRFEAPTANLPFSDAPRSIELWAYVASSIPGSEVFFGGYGAFGTFNQAYTLGALPASDSLFFSQWGLAVLGPQVLNGQWHHVAVTSSGSAVHLYMDGVLLNTASLPIQTAAGSLFFLGRVGGAWGQTRRLIGRVDEVTVYNRELTRSEVEKIFRAGSAGKCKST